MLKSRFKQVTPAEYDLAAVLIREVGDELLSRLDLVALKPKRILDAGCGVGYCSHRLKNRYPDAEVIAVDDAAHLVSYANALYSSSIHWSCAPLTALPADDQSMDLVVANLMLPWCDDFKKILQEWHRVLRPDGLLMFTTYGPDTLCELQGNQIELPSFRDMHDIGDALLQVGFADPVLDADYFTLTYKEQQRLQDELRLTGFISEEDHLKQLEKNSVGVIPLTYEVIYGHAWKPEIGKAVPAEGGIVKFPLSHLRGR